MAIPSPVEISRPPRAGCQRVRMPGWVCRLR
jgi:hypothetical protein